MVSSHMRVRKRKSSFFQRFSELFELRPNLQSVGAKSLALDQSRQFIERQEFTAANLFALQTKGAIMKQVIDHATRDGMFPDVMKWEERDRTHVDTKLLAALAARGFIERLARGRNAADGQIPVRRKDVFARGSLMDEQLALRVEDEQVNAAVRQAF